VEAAGKSETSSGYRYLILHETDEIAERAEFAFIVRVALAD